MAEKESVDRNRAIAGGSISLFKELQHILYEIAREAELGSEKSFDRIHRRADASLRLIESCLLSSRVEAGQLQLKLSPYGVGSIMHEAAHSLRTYSDKPISVQVGINQPAMTNSDMLKNLLFVAGNAICDSVNGPVEMRSFTVSSGDVGIGVFAKGLEVTSKELREAIDRSERSAMPLARHSQRSGIMLLLADTFANTLGGKLHVKKMGSYKGFATVLPRSRQLALV